MTMKKLILLLLLLSLTSCVAQQFPYVEPTYSKEVILPLTVGEIQDDTAWLYTETFKVKYEVDLGEFEIGKKYLFKLWVYPHDEQRHRRAKISWFFIHPDQAKIDIQEKMKSRSIR